MSQLLIRQASAFTVPAFAAAFIIHYVPPRYTVTLSGPPAGIFLLFFVLTRSSIIIAGTASSMVVVAFLAFSSLKA